MLALPVNAHLYTIYGKSLTTLWFSYNCMVWRVLLNAKVFCQGKVSRQKNLPDSISQSHDKHPCIFNFKGEWKKESLVRKPLLIAPVT